ncbi:SDR family oxidoreductase, partial [Klebsiella pneumoniae]|nr:SDR family oxidoreductase [Klebsiella pneumoniae]
HFGQTTEAPVAVPYPYKNAADLQRHPPGTRPPPPPPAPGAGDKRNRLTPLPPGLTRVEATEYVPAERHQLYENGRALSGAQQPEDVTGSVVWLLSDLSRFITGQLIPVNGGFVFN